MHIMYYGPCLLDKGSNTIHINELAPQEVNVVITVGHTNKEGFGGIGFVCSSGF